MTQCKKLTDSEREYSLKTECRHTYRVRLSRSSSSSCRSLWCPLFKSRIDWCRVCRCRSETSMSSKNRTASPSPWGAEEFHSLCQQHSYRFVADIHYDHILTISRCRASYTNTYLQSSHRWIFPLLFYLPHICISGYHLLCSKWSANVLTWLHSLQCGPLLFPVLSRVATFHFPNPGWGSLPLPALSPSIEVGPLYSSWGVWGAL